MISLACPGSSGACARIHMRAKIPLPPSIAGGFPHYAPSEERSTCGLGQVEFEDLAVPSLPPPPAGWLTTETRRLALRDQLLIAVAGSSLMPGPIVELIDTFLMKVPLAPVGLARLIAVTSAFTLAAMASSLNEALPTPA